MVAEKVPEVRDRSVFPPGFLVCTYDNPLHLRKCNLMDTIIRCICLKHFLSALQLCTVDKKKITKLQNLEAEYWNTETGRKA